MKPATLTEINRKTGVMVAVKGKLLTLEQRTLNSKCVCVCVDCLYDCL